MKRKIVAVENRKSSARLIKNMLETNGYDVYAAIGTTTGFNLITSVLPDIILINLEPELQNDFEFIFLIRTFTDTPIIALSEHCSEAFIIKALKSGVDRFVEKPIHLGMLLANINCIERYLEKLEALNGMNTDNLFQNGKLNINLNKHTVKIDNAHIHLTKNEFKILSLLCRYPDRVLTYDFIIKNIWGSQISMHSGILRVNMTNIRKKIEPDPQKPIYILTENGIGYRLAVGEQNT